MSHLHKRFSSEKVKELLQRYVRDQMERNYIQEILGIRRRRFFELLRQYKENPHHFTIQYIGDILLPASPRTLNTIFSENYPLKRKSFKIRPSPYDGIITVTSETGWPALHSEFGVRHR